MKTDRLEIFGKNIGIDSPCFIIAEVSQAHDGSLGFAHSYIDAVAAAGADAIKFQTHIAAAESTLGEPFRVKFSYEDATRYDYWKRMEFTEKQWCGLADHCAELGLIFLSSPFSVEAVELLERVGVPAWKVGSGEVNNPIILDAMTKTGKPILLSSGMSGWAELEVYAHQIIESKCKLLLFQCTSKYPTPLSHVGLNNIEELRKRFGVPVGLSDHSGTVYPAMVGMALGVDALEVHVVFSKEMFGPDTASSITLEQLQELVACKNAFHEILQNPVDKDEMASELLQMRQLFNKSIALRASMSKGDVLTREVLTVKKPGTGIPANKMDDCIGKRLARDVSIEDLLRLDDMEDFNE